MTMQTPGAAAPIATDTTNGVPAQQPAAVVPPVPPPAPAPAPVAAAAGGEEHPAWLPGRLAREREAAQRALLTELGVPDLPTARQRMAEAANMPTATARTATLEQTIKQRVDVELAQLTAEQRTAVTAIAGADPARVLTTIDQLRPTWGAPAAPAPAAAGTAAPPHAPVAPPPPAPTPPPADTAPGRVAPGGSPPPPATTHTAHHAALLKTNPFAAAAYSRQYGRLIAEGK